MRCGKENRNSYKINEYDISLEVRQHRQEHLIHGTSRKITNLFGGDMPKLSNIPHLRIGSLYSKF